jgi:hypothetical protein
VELHLAARVLGQRRQFVERQNLPIRLECDRSTCARASGASDRAKDGSGNSRRRDHLAMLSETVLASARAFFF